MVERTPAELQTGCARLRALVHEGVGWIIFDQPEKKNALSVGMQAALPGVLDAFAESDAVRVVVMRGAGDEAFASGADISEFEDHRNGPAPRADFDQSWGLATAAFDVFEKPVLAMIAGICFGGGLATALHADIRIASDDARFSIPAARLGLAYGYDGVERLLRQVSPSAAREILFSGRSFDAAKALHMGLVDRVVPKAGLVDATTELASQIADNAPLTVRAAKAAIRAASGVLRAPSGDEVQALITRCFESDDYREGRTAFLEKRRPVFRGR